jgi:hypothetical protein
MVLCPSQAVCVGIDRALAAIQRQRRSRPPGANRLQFPRSIRSIGLGGRLVAIISNIVDLG